MKKEEIEEKKKVKEMLEGSRRMYFSEIRKCENKISWYTRQITIIETSLEKLEKDVVLMVAKQVK